jgi:transposase-like protein
MDEIFISIASYRDEFLPFTIGSALAGARHPGRLRFGICWQAEEGERLDPYLGDPRFRIARFPYWESGGYGWSRAEVQKLYRGEKYHLLIDSHSYLAPGWDENLIAQLESKPSAKPLLTTSAPPFTFDAEGEVVLPWAGTEHDGVPLIRCSQNSPHGFLDFQMSAARSPGPNTRTCFMVCNFVFTHGCWIVDVPEDPDMINASHECALAVRSYTHGYDMFVPDEIQVWHLDYSNYREGFRRTVWETKSLSWQAQATNRLRERLDALIYGRGDAAILGRYGCGTARTVEEWAANARVDLGSSLAGASPARTPTSAEARRGTGVTSNRIAVLVLACASPPYDQAVETIRRTWGGQSLPQLDIFYLYGNPNDDRGRRVLSRYIGRSVPVVPDDVIRQVGDVLIAGCADDMSEQEDCLLRKRLIAFHHLAADDRYDLIYSVCAASYVDQRALVRYAETLIPSRMVAGEVFVDESRTAPFVSGASMLLSLDIARALGHDRKAIIEGNAFGPCDDVAMGHWIATRVARVPAAACIEDIERGRPLTADHIFVRQLGGTVHYVLARVEDQRPLAQAFHYHFHSQRSDDMLQFHRRYFV